GVLSVDSWLLLRVSGFLIFSFFFQAEDGIRDRNVTGVQTCALPICARGCSTTTGPGRRGRGRHGPVVPGRVRTGGGGHPAACVGPGQVRLVGSVCAVGGRGGRGRRAVRHRSARGRVPECGVRVVGRAPTGFSVRDRVCATQARGGHARRRRGRGDRPGVGGSVFAEHDGRVRGGD